MSRREAFENLVRAWREFIIAVGRALYIDRLLDWLTRHLERRKRS